MDAKQDILTGKWHELKGQVRQQWGKLTDDDLLRLSGKTEQLAGVLQQRYGYGKAQAETEINKWVSKHDTKVKSAQHLGEINDQ
ncbi:MAG: CsbD family protein [Thermoflexales bacterium]